MAFFLHELIPLELGRREPDVWRGDLASGEKDIVYIPDPSLSVEIKCSSHPAKVFANRSYAQKPTDAKKGKSGYYLTVNFEKLTPSSPQPKVVLVRFGWLDHSDWSGQAAPTGQQASLSPQADQGKLVVLYRA